MLSWGQKVFNCEKKEFLLWHIRVILLSKEPCYLFTFLTTQVHKNCFYLPLPASFLFIFDIDSLQLIVNINCGWLDSNCRSLALEATALSTEPQPLPFEPLFRIVDMVNCCHAKQISGLKSCYLTQKGIFHFVQKFFCLHWDLLLLWHFYWIHDWIENNNKNPQKQCWMKKTNI